MRKRKRDPNIERAGVIPECAPASRGCEWYVVLSVSAEDVIDNKGAVVAVWPRKMQAQAAALRINEAIRAAVERSKAGAR